jgi:hypothetical protein
MDEVLYGRPLARATDHRVKRGIFVMRFSGPRGPTFTLAEGTDPTGNRYVVKARRYRNGLAAVRNRGDGNQDLGPETRAVIPLRGPMAPILPSGTIGAVVSTVSLRNGEGVLLLGGR